MGVEQHLQPGEEIVFRAHPTRIGLIPPLAGAAVAGIAGLVIFHSSGRNPLPPLLAGVVVLALLLVALVKYVRLISNEYILTNQRMIQQYGILAKRSVDSYLSKINNVEHRQSLWGRILGYGDVEIDTASEVGETLFPNIAHPVEFKTAILAACEAYRVAPAASAPPAHPSDGAERLRQLKSLLDDGLISREEFEAKRKQLVQDL
ncbi:MAG TPA: PH domain-containing protein [Thermoanaerobaculia bacterium]|nr:PH domain-containing protein [Thermoanaerobaculia bacterium]